MTIQWWQILLLTCLAFWAIIDQLTVSIVNNPLAIGMISGIIMGDITTGLAVGATLQLMVLGVSTYGGASMPDFMTGAIVGTVYAVISGKGGAVCNWFGRSSRTLNGPTRCFSQIC